MCEGAWYASGHLEALGVSRGRTVLVDGASGAIGTAAVQLAKHRGAEVTAVVATPHLDLVRFLGADHVADYTAEDFTRIPRRFAAVLDAVGKTTSFRCRRLLEPGGVFAATDLGPWCQNPLLALWSVTTRSGRVLFPLSTKAADVVGRLAGLMEAGELRAVVDRRYPLATIVDAYRYVETGQKVGIVVVDVEARRELPNAGPLPASS